MEKIAIITINFNTEDLVKRLIKCLMNQSYENWELLIVNNSKDDFKIKYVLDSFDKKIYLLNINKNIGYSSANNIGFKYLWDNKIISANDIVLFINEDIVVKDENFFSKAINLMKKLNCNFLGPKIINNDKTLMLPHKKRSNYFKCLFHIGNNGLIDKIFQVNRSLKRLLNPVKVFLINGACFFTLAGSFNDVGLFDPNTFVYYAEELLFLKVKTLNMDVYYVPEIEVFHDHSGTFRKNFNLLLKKKLVFDAEIYFLENILNINKIGLAFFKFERLLEMFFYKLIKKANCIRTT